MSKETERDFLSTSGSTAKLRLTADRSELEADSEELSFLLIEAIDEENIPVYGENGSVTVTVENDA